MRFLSLAAATAGSDGHGGERFDYCGHGGGGSASASAADAAREAASAAREQLAQLIQRGSYSSRPPGESSGRSDGGGVGGHRAAAVVGSQQALAPANCSQEARGAGHWDEDDVEIID
eukprot:1089429-Prorocentrum_minimum.AAC.5